MENIKDSKRYYDSFIKELEDYKNLTQEEFYKEYIYKDLPEDEDEIYDSIRDYNSPLDWVEYESKEWYKYIEMAIWLWWPNIWLNINTRWSKVTYEFHWSWDNLTEDISYYYDEIISMYWIIE